MFAIGSAACCLSVCAPPALSAVQQSNGVITGFDAPLQFVYGSWEKRAAVENGRLVVRGEGATGQGGGGTNAALNLAANAAELSPAVRLKIGAGNKIKALRLLVRDAAGKTATWDFDLPTAASGDALVTLTPREAAPLATPNETEKGGMPDLARLTQWQIVGDWSVAPADLELDAVLLVSPDAAMRTARADAARRVAEEQARVRAARAERRAKYGARGPNSPTVAGVSLVAPNVVSVAIQAGRVVRGGLSPYTPQPGDTQKTDNQAVRLVRGGQEVGWLIGPKKDHLVTFERLEGDPLLDDVIGEPANYAVTSKDDAAYVGSVRPTAVFRKTKPTDWAQPGRGFAMRHIIYLQLPAPLTPGKTYAVSLGDLNVCGAPAVTFVCDPARVRSEAIHVNQIGFRPDDPVKRAFLSVWLGTGGVLRYESSLAFSLVDDKTGKAVYNGKVVLAKDVDEPEQMQRTENFNKTSVYQMDFGDFKTPGRYRVVVAGVGCSYAFPIGAKTWETAFVTQMQGFVNERSGIALGPPVTPFVKPRDFHPADGAPVFQSTFAQPDGGGGSEFDVAKPENVTKSVVPEAWGGWHDAGDWNPRRATHLRAAMNLLELCELFPAYFAKLSWPLPPDGAKPGTPAVLREALFELDLFRRLQRENGAVGYGIETSGDPIEGEVSWLQSMPAYVFAPDLWSSYVYATAAGRAAKVLAVADPTLAKTYRTSALKAMTWAEGEWAKRKAAGTLAGVRWEARDSRNHAALVCYALSGDKRWHDIFLENTFLTDPNGKSFAWGDHVQRDAAFAYARLPEKLADPTLRKNAVRALVAEADAALDYAHGNAFNLTTPDKGKPMFLGFYSVPDAVELVRAHFLTKKSEYLAGIVRACQFGAGANPNNMTYTTGVGQNPVRHPLHLDSRRTGQPAPAGLTVYGNFDFVRWADQQWAMWPMQYYLGPQCVPSAYEWPIPEAYFDIFLYPATNEFTIDQTMGPNAFVWGYLAARPVQ